MKATGIVRAMDQLGRIVIPKELRRTMHLVEGQEIEIFTEGDSIILSPNRKHCMVCGSEEERILKKKNNICICSQCIKEFTNESCE